MCIQLGKKAKDSKERQWLARLRSMTSLLPYGKTFHSAKKGSYCIIGMILMDIIFALPRFRTHLGAKLELPPWVRNGPLIQSPHMWTINNGFLTWRSVWQASVYGFRLWEKFENSFATILWNPSIRWSDRPNQGVMRNRTALLKLLVLLLCPGGSLRSVY